jgi:hypothetical protein
MQADPLAEWQRLTQLYREMGDGELEELDADKGDLTEVAQQVLGDEIRKRGLDKPSGPSNETDASKRFGISPWSRNGDSSAAEDTTEESNLPVEYTWKAPLCECEDSEKVRQVQEVLRRAGIESWIEGPGYSVALEMSSPRIEVAADQLEQAREIIANEQVRQESLAVSAGLKRQDAGLLDELIVRYQHRLLRYLLYLTGNQERPKTSFRRSGCGCWYGARSSTATRGSRPGCLPLRATW